MAELPLLGEAWDGLRLVMGLAWDWSLILGFYGLYFVNRKLLARVWPRMSIGLEQ